MGHNHNAWASAKRLTSRGSFAAMAGVPALVALLFLLCAVRSTSGVTYRVIHSKIDDTADSHATTRTTVRHVFRHDRQWYVFCGDHRDERYYSFFVTSIDGINWSARKVGKGGGVTSCKYGSPDYHESPIIVGNTVYCTASDNSTNDLMIRSGRIADGDIIWSEPATVARGKLSPRESYGYYPDIAVETDGRLSLTCRHYYLDESSKPHLDPVFVIAAKPGDISNWQAPVSLLALPEPQMADGHENIPLPDGRRVLIFRTHNKVYRAGTPGNFLAFHWDGTKWSEPVDLGNSDGINGSDKRLCSMFDPGSKLVHLLYIEDSGTLWNNELRHRTLASPYGTSDWSCPVTVDMNVFTVTMGMDTSQDPARVAAVYGNQKYTPGGRWGGRQHTGELYLKWSDGKSWESESELISEPGDERAWYPSVSQVVSGTFGVLYLKGQPNGKIFELRSALVEPTSRNEPD